jgi:hypothetical protein
MPLMKNMKIWKSALSFIAFFILSVLGAKPNTATAIMPNADTQAEIASNETILTQACPYNNPRLRYGRVATQDGDDLYIRSRPNGKVIGAVPFGWAVVTVKRDATNQWVYIDEQYPSGSAPDLTRGWVAAKFIKPLGRFCEKPRAFIRTNMHGLFANKQVLVNEHWVQMSDRLADSLKKLR